MFSHSTNTASLFSVLIAALIFSLSLPGVACAQSNTSLGSGALVNSTTGVNNTAIGGNALFFNTTGSQNTATGLNSLLSNTTGTFNTVLQSEVNDLKAKHVYFETVAARLEALELRKNQTIQITAEKNLGDQMVDVMP